MGTTGDAPPPTEAHSVAGAGRPHSLAAHRQRLEQVEAALRQWDQRDEAVRRARRQTLPLPDEAVRPVSPLPDVPPRPSLTRQSLEELRASLLEELAHLEEHT